MNNRSPRRRFLALIGMVALSLSADLALAYDENSPSPLNLDTDGLALKGYDPVAYFNGAQPTLGSEKITARHEGAVYRFSTAANRDVFVANPEKYAPAFGGFCAMGAAMGKKLDVDPQAWRVVNGKLYLNVSKGAQGRWLDDVPGNLAKAEKNWPMLKSKPPKGL